MDGSKKRRICGAAAFSATALASLLGAKAAGAEAVNPPGLVRACEAQNSSPGLASLSFKQGWPSKFEGVQGIDCSSSSESLYNWWKKI